MKSVAQELNCAGNMKQSAILEFTAEGINNANVFDARKMGLDDEIKECINWRKHVSNKEAEEYRENAIKRVEERSQDLWKAGQVPASRMNMNVYI